MSLRLRRSELSTPASSERMMEKAAKSDADMVFLDLEDAVAPAEKPAARHKAVEALKTLDWGKKTLAVRVNDAESPWAFEDVVTVVEGAGEELDVLVIPKVKAARDVWFFDTLLSQLEMKLDLSPIGLEILIEETEALSRVEEIAHASPRLETLILGVGDLAASQGVQPGPIGPNGERYPGDIWHFARARLVVAARAAGLDAIDGPYVDFGDTEGYLREASWAASLGFVGKWAIHPSQIALANQVYSPTDEQIAEAREIIATCEEAERQGRGAVGAKGVMMDAATVRLYRLVVERANLIGK